MTVCRFVRLVASGLSGRRGTQGPQSLASRVGREAARLAALSDPGADRPPAPTPVPPAAPGGVDRAPLSRRSVIGSVIRTDC